MKSTNSVLVWPFSTINALMDKSGSTKIILNMIRGHQITLNLQVLKPIISYGLPLALMSDHTKTCLKKVKHLKIPLWMISLKMSKWISAVLLLITNKVISFALMYTIMWLKIACLMQIGTICAGMVRNGNMQIGVRMTGQLIIHYWQVSILTSSSGLLQASDLKMTMAILFHFIHRPLAMFE